VNPSNFSNIIGFVAELSDDNKSMVFKRKDLTQKKNNWGAYLQNDNGKMPIIKKVNEILAMVGSHYCFDDEKCPEPTRNTDDISKIAFAGIFELLIRKFNEDKENGKIWYLRPEIAIYNKISNPTKV
jgi:hypothetical protein